MQTNSIGKSLSFPTSPKEVKLNFFFELFLIFLFQEKAIINEASDVADVQSSGACLLEHWGVYGRSFETLRGP